MKILELTKINKTYKNGDNATPILKDVSIEFVNAEFVTILGKSGSGKTTLLNIMSTIEKPDSGEVLYFGRNVSKFSRKKVNEFRNKEIGIIFQHYYLIEDKSALFNVMLPMLISGYKEIRAKEDAELLLKSINFPQSLYEQKVKDLSGGEKERIALLRGLINNPKIIFADEPTGALDKGNSILVMETLKKLSKNKLVIVVSHNRELAEKYSDRIIEIEDGKIVKDDKKTIKENTIKLVKHKNTNKAHVWVQKISKSNFAKRFKLHLFSCISLTVSICFFTLIYGFNANAKNSIHNQMYEYFDYEALTVSKTIKTSKTDNGFSIVKTVRPSLKDIYSSYPEIYENFYICNNYDSLIVPVGSVYAENSKLDSCSISYVRSFDDIEINENKIILKNEKLNDCDPLVVVNAKFLEMIQKNTTKSINNVCIKSNFTFTKNDRLIDTFEFSENFNIALVVKEPEFMNTPKIFISYEYLDQLMSNKYSNGVSWKEIVETEEDNSEISSYSYRLFLKNKNFDISKLIFDNELSLTSNALIINNTLEQFTDIAGMGMFVFLIIAVLGTVLIIGISSLFNYVRDKRMIALLSCLGAKFSYILDIYAQESLLGSLIGLITGLLLGLGLEHIINYIVETATGLKSLLVFPWYEFHSIPFGLVVLIVSVFIGIVLVSSCVPIALSKRVSIKEELKE